MTRKPPWTEDDEKLWSHFTKSIRPLHPKKTAKTRARPAPKKRPQHQLSSLQHKTERHTPIPSGQTIDGATARKLRRGKLPVDGRIDLHGMRQNEAFEALSRFIRASHATGRRCVLVITGKGRARDGYEQPGILRRNVPEWLQTGSLAPLVVGFETAHVRDGGDGALYVLLRRKR